MCIRDRHEAAFALGLSKKQTMLDIILPQTMKAVLPPIVNEAITLVKDTALASALPMVELIDVYKRQLVNCAALPNED